MDADEYLRISHEVKALKTAMLKLKRELQTDQNVSVCHHLYTDTRNHIPHHIDVCICVFIMESDIYGIEKVS